MNILFVGWGFQPFRAGGLIEYAEDLMEIAAKKGYEVNYFCTGRFSILSKKPFLKKWKNKKGYTVYEIWNPPVISGYENGIENPVADITEKTTEKFFIKVLKQLSPGIVHFHEFLGFPTSLTEEIKLLNIKTVFTVQDYYYLCPTIKLVLPNGEFCSIKGEQLGKQCAICCRNAPKNNLNYKLQNLYPAIFNIKTVTFLQKIKKILLNDTAVSEQAKDGYWDEKKVNDFNTRRDYNLAVLPKVDLIIAMSHKVAEIFNYYKPLDNMLILNLTLKHIDQIQPGEFAGIKTDRINFGIINALSAPLKGRDLLMALFEMIDVTAWKHQVEFTVMGRVDESDIKYLKQYDFVKLTGKFKAASLDQLLDDLNIQVGIVPSVWEEAYGFVGIEFLAKGIPVIGNNMGGIPDYVTKETGWLNKTNDTAGLLKIITELVKNPESISVIRRNLVDNRNNYIKNIDTHFNEMDVIYKNLLNNVS